MISAFNRFHGRKAIEAVYKNGRSVRGDYLNIRYAQSKRHDYRLAVVVSRKVSKSAVTRNRIRRRIYEIVRLHRKELDRPIGYDFVISVFEDKAAHVPAEEISKAVNKLLDKALR